jgi:hypothetical protein
MGSALQSDGGNEARICGLKHQREKRSMAILLDWTFRSRRRASASFDDTGRIVREVKAASEPEALLQVLTNPAYHFKADWIGSRAAVAMAFQRSRRSRLAGDLS